MIVCVFSIDNKYENQGKLGAAVIGSHSASDVSRYSTLSLFLFLFLFLYDDDDDDDVQ